MAEHDHDHEHDEEEVLDLEEVLEDAPPEVREMVALSMGFAACLAAQNEILAQQRESVLQISATAVEVAQDVLEWEDDDDDEAEGAVETAVQHLRDAGDQFEESARAALSMIQGQTAAVEQLGAGETGGDFRSQALATVYRATAQALANAVQNTVAAQQQLNTLAQASLAQATELLLSLIEEEEDEDDDEEV
jgi:hypothetical protein